ncbi:MAG: HAD family hydrolase [Verrucomicrobia bacterium]|nr:MAG: HAD family hydrolase [Verrucomicrobiota bacterium]
MSPRFHTVLFDLDGTLLDHFAAIHRAHNHVRTHYELPAATRDEVMRAIGGGLPEALKKTLGPSHAHRLEEALPIYRAYWDATMLDDAALFPGAQELLETLRAAGILCAVLTNKHGHSARRVCSHLGLDPLLAGVWGATDTPWLKPEPAFLHFALKQLGARTETTALVGDSPWDVQAAIRGQLGGSFMVTTGTHTEEELRAHGALEVAPRLLALAPALTG